MFEFHSMSQRQNEKHEIRERYVAEVDMVRSVKSSNFQNGDHYKAVSCHTNTEHNKVVDGEKNDCVVRSCNVHIASFTDTVGKKGQY